jgi:hypothetical protein
MQRLRPARSRKSSVREIEREYAVMEMPGSRRMLSVLLLGGQRLETPRIAVLDSHPRVKVKQLTNRLAAGRICGDESATLRECFSL